MSNHRSARQTFDLLRRLQREVGEFATREQRLLRTCQDQNALLAHQQQTALQTEQDQAAARLAQTEAYYQTLEERWHHRCNRRRDTIARIRQTVQDQALAHIEEEEGRRKYALQKNLLETERTHKSDLAANDEAHETVRANLADRQEAFLALEQDAQGAFRGYRGFRQQLVDDSPSTEPDPALDESQLIEKLDALYEETSQGLRRFRRFPLAALFRYVPLWLAVGLLVVIHGAAVPASAYLEWARLSYLHVGLSLLLGLAVLGAFHQMGRRRAAPLAATLAGNLRRARHWHDLALQKASDRHQLRIQEIEQEFQSRTQLFHQQWEAAVSEAGAQRVAWPEAIEAKAARVATRNEQLRPWRAERLRQEREAALARLRRESDARREEMARSFQSRLDGVQAAQQEQWQTLQTDWQRTLRSVYDTVDRADQAARADFPEWRPDLWQAWTPPASFLNAVKIGSLEVDLPKFCEVMPQDPRLALPGPAHLSVPLLLTYPDQGSILFETTHAGSEPVAGTLNNLILRLLAQSPPGRFIFTIIDPVKLGQNFAGVMHLADYEENLINRRIWTQTGEIEQRLADLNEHMEKVIQMYLRNEYDTIAEYNEQAGTIAEKYHFLVIADFPVNFSETALRRLLNIAASGARCGVYTLIHWDRRQPLLPDLVLDDLRKNSLCLAWSGRVFTLADPSLGLLPLQLDAPPSPELATEFLKRVGLGSRHANRVEVPFEQVAPAREQFWTLTTTEELRVPIGRTGATKLQQLAIGKGTRQHALVAGKTGSGKSTLFHVIISNLALWCSPEQVEFYLVDFKKGVEFKCYAARRLPHARVVAIESDREFGLSVLQRVDDELKRRGDLFRQLAVQDIPGYQRAGGREPMPRCLLIIDEFQEFFVEDDRISQGAAVLLDRIVRQGRAFGIHVLLGSQTLGGAYTLARTTLGQMVIRIALQCNEADAYLIMDDNNPAPRLLSRPGEGIYNDMAGAIEGNSPFQAVWLPDDEREKWLDLIRAHADQSPRRYPSPFVFEGNAPADVRDNFLLQDRLQVLPTQSPPAARIWLGAPNSIKGPTEAVLQRQSGSNLLLVGQNDEAILALFSVALLALAAQHPVSNARFVILDSTTPESSQREYLERVVRALPQPVTLARGGDLPEVLGQLNQELKRRSEAEQAATAPAIYLFLLGLQTFKKLRQEDEFSFSVGDSDAPASPAALLQDLICEGAAAGIHVIAGCDTYNNVNRFLARKALSEFEMRVLFQMSANDSASLIDSPKASTLGLHRALFYNEQEGYLETFRPYSLVPGDWLEQVAGHLRRSASD